MKLFMEVKLNVYNNSYLKEYRIGEGFIYRRDKNQKATLTRAILIKLWARSSDRDLKRSVELCGSLMGSSWNCICFLWVFFSKTLETSSKLEIMNACSSFRLQRTLENAEQDGKVKTDKKFEPASCQKV